METWVKDLKTGQSWMLDDDESKIVYQRKDGSTEFKLRDISRFRFYPMNPEVYEANQHALKMLREHEFQEMKKEIERKRLQAQANYQLTIFDFMEE